MVNVNNLRTPAEAARILGCGLSTIYKNVKAGAPVHYKTAKRRGYMIDPTEYQEWIDAQAQLEKEQPRNLTVMELRAARHAMFG